MKEYTEQQRQLAQIIPSPIESLGVFLADYFELVLIDDSEEGLEIRKESDGTYVDGGSYLHCVAFLKGMLYHAKKQVTYKQGLYYIEDES